MASNAKGAADEIDLFALGLDVTETQMLELGHFATDMIVLRTKQGIDVDHNAFAPYSPEYAKERAAAGLSTRPDLARTGHMLGALVPNVIARDEVAIQVTNPLEATKLGAHDSGVDKAISVRTHSRNTYVNKKGQRVSRDEVRRDARRKNKRLSSRREDVEKHTRHMKLPKREVMDIRHSTEMQAIADEIGNGIIAKVTK